MCSGPNLLLFSQRDVYIRCDTYAHTITLNVVSLHKGNFRISGIDLKCQPITFLASVMKFLNKLSSFFWNLKFLNLPLIHTDFLKKVTQVVTSYKHDNN